MNADQQVVSGWVEGGTAVDRVHPELLEQLAQTLSVDYGKSAAANLCARVRGGRAGSVASIESDPARLAQTLIALGDLLAHVGEVGMGYLSRLGEDGGSGLGLVGVQMHLECVGIADDEHGVAERFERRDEAGGVEAVAGDGEVSAVTVGAGAVLGVADARGGVMIERRRVLAAQGGDDAGEDDGQPVTARVHDASFAQRGEQLGAALDGLLPGNDGPLERVGDGESCSRGSVAGPRRGSGPWATSVTIL